MGRALARRGHTVLCGGLSGVMDAVCRGARPEGGHTIGILPGLDRRAANPHVEFAIPTGLNAARNAVVALAGEAMIAVDGSYGTLSEIAFALQFGRPVVGLQTWRADDGSGRDPILRVESAEEAVDLAVSLASAAAARSAPS